MTHKLTPGDGDPRHGTNGYNNLKCRCNICRHEHATLMRQQKKQRATRLAADPRLATHGRASTYGNWACRCDKCRAAWSVDSAAHRHKRNTVRHDAE